MLCVVGADSSVWQPLRAARLDAMRAGAAHVPHRPSGGGAGRHRPPHTRIHPRQHRLHHARYRVVAWLQRCS